MAVSDWKISFVVRSKTDNGAKNTFSAPSQVRIWWSDTPAPSSQVGIWRSDTPAPRPKLGFDGRTLRLPRPNLGRHIKSYIPPVPAKLRHTSPVLSNKKCRNTARCYDICTSIKSGGAGGSRTRVQTRKPYAFYTLIPACGFRALARPGPPTNALSSKASSAAWGGNKLFPIYQHRLTKELRNNSLWAMSRSITL